MKKLAVLIALALLAVAGTGYAQTTQTPTAPALPGDAGPKGVQLLAETNWNEGGAQSRLYIPVTPCRVYDTTTFQGPIQQDEVRMVPVSHYCGVPDEAVDITFQAKTIGVSVWGFIGQGFLYVESASTTPKGGVDTGAGYVPAPFGYFDVGRIENYDGAAELVKTTIGFTTYKALEFKAVYGDTHLMVDVTGYTLPRQSNSTPAPAGLVWRGVWNSSQSYIVNDVVTAPNGLWTKTVTDWEIMNDWNSGKARLKKCLATSSDYKAFAACALPYLQ